MKLGEVKPKVGRERVDLDDILGMVKLPKGKWVTLRILPIDVLPVRRHWVNIIAGKDKREVKIPKICVAFDPATEANKKGVECPYCELADGPEQFYLANVIVRSEQEDAPARIKMSADEKASGFKNVDGESWTPVRVLRITSSLAKKIQGLKDLNKVKSKKTGKTLGYDVSHERFGKDVNVKYDGDAKGADKYQIQLGERTPLTEEEQGYLVWELHEGLLDQIGRESEQEAKTEIKRMQIVGDSDLPEEDEEDELALGKRKKAPAGKKASRQDEDEDEEDEDEDDDPPPRKKAPAKKAPAKRRAPPEDEDEDEDDEDEDEDDEDDEDDPPPRKKAPAKKAPARRRSPPDDDDDDIPF